MGMEINFDPANQPAPSSPEQYFDQRTSKHQNDALKAVAFAPVGVPLGAIDTVGQSIRLLDDDTISSSLSAINATAGEIYDSNKSGYRAIGDLGTAVIGGIAVTKLLRSSSFLANAANSSNKGVSFAAKVLRSDTKAVDNYVEMLEKQSLLQGAKGLTNTLTTANRNTVWKARGVQAVNDLKEGLAAEAFIAAAQNKSELFFPEGQSKGDLLTAAGGGLVFGNVIGQMILTPALKRAHSAAGLSASKRGDQVTGQDGIDLVVASGLKDEVVTDNGEFANLINADPELAAQRSNIKTEATARIQSITDKFASNEGLEGINKATPNLVGSTAVAETMEELAKTNPQLTARVVSIDASSAHNDFVNKGPIINAKLEAQLSDAQVKLKATDDPAETIVISNEIEDINKQLESINGGVSVVKVNRLGNIGSEVNNPTLYDESNIKFSNVKVDSVGDNQGKTIVYADVARSRKAGNVNKTTSYGTAIDGSIWSATSKSKKKLGSTFGLSEYDQSKVYTAQVRALDQLGTTLDDAEALAKIKPTKIAIHSAHETLDYVVNAVQRYGEDGTGFLNLSKVLDLSDFKSLEDIKFASMNAKYNRYNKIMDAYEAGLKSGTETMLHPREVLGNTLMLKMSDDYGRNNYALEFFGNARTSGALSLGDDYVDMMDNFSKDFSIGANDRTVFGVRKNGGVDFYDDLIQVDYAKRLGSSKSTAFSMTVDSPTINSELFDTVDLAAHAKIMEAERLGSLSGKLRTEELVQDSLGELDLKLEQTPQLIGAIRGNILKVVQGAGTNPLNKNVGQVLPTTNSFGLRGVAGNEAYQDLSDIVQRHMREWSKNQLTNNLKVTQRLLEPGNEKSARNLLMLISSERMGWGVLSDTADDLGRFKLDPNSKRNKAIVNDTSGPYKGTMPEYMPVINSADPYTPLRMGELELEALKELRRISNIEWASQNIMSRNLGFKGRVNRNLHTPRPRNYDERVYITDANGRVIDYVTGNSRQQAKDAARKFVDGENKKALSNGESGGFGLIDRDNVELWKEANNQVITADALAFGAGDGAKARGARGVVYQDVRYIQDMLDEVSSIGQDMGRQYTLTKFAPEFANLRRNEVIAGVDNKGGVGSFVDGKNAQSFNSVYQSVANSLLNTSQRNTGSLYGGLGVLTENSLGSAWNGALGVLEKAGAFSYRSKNWDAVSKELAKDYGFDPMKFATDLADRSVSGRTLPKGGSAVRKLAGLTQALALKWGEVGHAALTTASIMTTTPHAIKYMRKLPNETSDQYITRVGYAGDLLDDATAVPNSTKLTLSVIQKRMSGQYKDVLADAAKAGYTNAVLSEFVDEMTVKRGGKLGKLLKMADKGAGYLSTKSEDLAREIAFLAGYELYKNIGKNGHQISMAAANNIANKAIADYRPHQRAELFKGNSGVPLAMFQTFAINYFQRLASSVENKAWGAALVQGGTQAFMFGGQSVPGFELFNEVLLENWDETRRPEDLFRNGFKSEKLGQLLLYGTPSTLPMILGADDGVALHTRGEMQLPRNITPASIFNTPFFNMVSRSSQALKEGFATGVTELGNGGGQALQESLVYMNPNRPSKGLMEIWQGYSTNKNGDLVNNEITGWINGAIHAAGLKTVREAEKGAALWRDRSTDIHQRQATDRLGRAFRAQVRSRNLNEISDNDIVSIAEKYVAYGGSERGAKRWLKNNIAKATISKFDRELQKKIRSSERGREWLNFMEIAEG